MTSSIKRFLTEMIPQMSKQEQLQQFLARYPTCPRCGSFWENTQNKKIFCSNTKEDFGCLIVNFDFMGQKLISLELPKYIIDWYDDVVSIKNREGYQPLKLPSLPFTCTESALDRLLLLS